MNLYTTREPGLIRPLLDAFTKASGVKVNTVFVDKGLTERVAAEGARSAADVVMTVDIGNLIELVDRDLAQPVRSPPWRRRFPPTSAIPRGAGSPSRPAPGSPMPILTYATSPG